MSKILTQVRASKDKGMVLVAISATIFLSVLLGLGSQASAAEVGLVDMQKAVQATEAGKKARDEMESEVNKKRKEFEKKEADLRKTSEDIEKKRSVLSSEALAKKQSDLQVESVKLQRDMAQTQLDLQKRERDLVEPILKKMKEAVSKIAKEKGLRIVFENNPSVLYNEDSVDITTEVLKAYEKAK